MQLDLFPEAAEESVESGTMLCRKCSTDKPYSQFREAAVIWETQPRKKHAPKYTGVLRYCNSCSKAYTESRKIAQKNAPPKPVHDFNCKCCGSVTKPSSAHMDHDHITHAFRGWLCRACNTGIGSLGDTVEGLEKAINYLKDHYEQH